MLNHPHQHILRAIGRGNTLEKALTHALEGLNDPEGHGTHLNFKSFKVVEIDGVFEDDGSTIIQATVEGLGTHRD